MKPQNLIHCSAQEFKAIHGSNKVDIAFVGSGLASTSVFLELLKLLKTSNEKHLHKTYVFFDPDGDFGQGVAYGSKSGKQSLLITPLKDFLPEPILTEFIIWISANFDKLLNYQNEELGGLSKKWFAKNTPKLKDGLSHDICVPRYFFGVFFYQKVVEAVLSLHNEIRVYVINETVTSITKKGKHDESQFSITTDDNFSLQTRQAILGIG